MCGCRSGPSLCSKHTKPNKTIEIHFCLMFDIQRRKWNYSTPIFLLRTMTSRVGDWRWSFSHASTETFSLAGFHCCLLLCCDLHKIGFYAIKCHVFWKRYISGSAGNVALAMRVVRFLNVCRCSLWLRGSVGAGIWVGRRYLIAQMSFLRCLLAPIPTFFASHCYSLLFTYLWRRMAWCHTISQLDFG